LFDAQHQSAAALLQSGRADPSDACSLLGVKRTSLGQRRMSALPPKSGHVQCTRRCPLCANSGHQNHCLASDDLNFRQSQSAASTRSEPRTAETTSRSEMAILSRPGQIPNARNKSPPMRAPARPSARLRKRPKPPRSQVINAPARPPPSSPTTIQTTSWSTDGIVNSFIDRFGLQVDLSRVGRELAKIAAFVGR